MYVADKFKKFVEIVKDFYFFNSQQLRLKELQVKKYRKKKNRELQIFFQSHRKRILHLHMSLYYNLSKIALALKKMK